MRVLHARMSMDLTSQYQNALAATAGNQLIGENAGFEGLTEADRVGDQEPLARLHQGISWASGELCINIIVCKDPRPTLWQTTLQSAR